MLKIGLTGGIACGKTLVGEMFAGLGAHLVQADRIAHELMLPGRPVYNEVVRHFGREILNPNMTVNRTRLAEVAFGSEASHDSPTSPMNSEHAPLAARFEELNRIVHPAVIRAQEEWMEEIGRYDPHAIAMVEAALIIEAGAGKHFDRLIMVTCAGEQRVTRFAARQKIDFETARKEVARRMAAQLPDAEKIKAADFVIDNSGTLEHTREQVLTVWEKLRSEA